MATVLLVLVVVLVIAALVFGVVSLLSGDDPGLVSVEPDGRARPLPNNRSLTEADLTSVRFDVGLRGYRMAQVDRVLRRTAYDVGYKDEMIVVLEAEVVALRDGRRGDADQLRTAREVAANTGPQTPTRPVEAAAMTSATTSAGPDDAPGDAAHDDTADHDAAAHDAADHDAVDHGDDDAPQRRPSDVVSGRRSPRA